MMEQIKLFFYNHKSWVYNLQYIFYSLILVVLVTLIDLRIIPVQEFLPDIITMDVALSRSVLTTLAGSLLTITTFTFSTILVILNMYASSFTPRVVENFVNIKITMKVLGIFIGGFFYCITTLIFMQDFFEHQHLIAGTVAIIYSIVCIVYFVRFVQAVLKNFQGVNLIYDIAEEAKVVIANEVEKRSASLSEMIQDEHSCFPIKSMKSGYLGIIDIDRIASLLKDHEGFIDIKVKIGEFIGEETILAQIHILKNDITEENIEKLSDCFILQDKKISIYNYRYNLTKLQEIALRAISPGINDPNTAIHCINKIGVLLLPLSQVNSYHIKQEKDTSVEIFYSSHSFEEDMEYLYVPLIEYAKTDLSVIQSILRSFYMIRLSATTRNRKVIDKLAKHIEQKVDDSLSTDFEKQIFMRELEPFKLEQA